VAGWAYLLRQTGLTRGNLAAHLSKLEEAGYIEIEKCFSGKKPQTICRLTETGQVALTDYCHSLKHVLDQSFTAGQSARQIFVRVQPFTST